MSTKETVKHTIEEVKKGRLKIMLGQILWVYSYAKKHWLAMALYTMVGMTSTVTALINATVSRDLVDIITGAKPASTQDLIKAFLFMIGLNLGIALLSQVSSFISSLVAMNVGREIQADIFSKILGTDWESLSKFHTGDLLTRWGTDTGAISNAVLNFIPNLIITVFRFGSAFAMVIYNDWTFAIFCFIGMPVSLALSRTLMRRMVNNNQRSMALAAKTSGFNQETFSNIQTIKAFDLVDTYVKYLKKLQQDYIDMKIDFAKMSIWTSLIMTTVGLIVSYSGYAWGIYRVATGVITYGSMTMFLSLSGTLTGALSSLTGLVPSTISLCVSAGRIMEITELPREDYSKRPEVKEFYEKHINEGVSINVEDLTYNYANGTSVFEHASMVARPHEVIGLVGPSGQGKTTMMRLLLALVNPTSGNVKVYAGADTKKGESLDMTPSARQLFSYVPQGNTMFSGTIAENMRNVKEDATDEEIIQVLKDACAWEFVEKMQGQINAPLKERGGGISEGQAQRLSIARALLRQSPILLLDEATSALDVTTENLVLKNLVGQDNPRTCIVTTHRPTVLKSCDRVYAISDRGLRILSDDEIDAMILGLADEAKTKNKA